MPNLLALFAALIITIAPLFVQRSWRHARVLLVGAILAPGRRTMASVLRITGQRRDTHFTNDHRVLSRAPWIVWGPQSRDSLPYNDVLTLGKADLKTNSVPNCCPCVSRRRLSTYRSP